MKVACSLLLGGLAGFLGHQARPRLRQDFSGGWFPIACYVVGVMLMSPFVLGLY